MVAVRVVLVVTMAVSLARTQMVGLGCQWLRSERALWGSLGGFQGHMGHWRDSHPNSVSAEDTPTGKPSWLPVMALVLVWNNLWEVWGRGRLVYPCFCSSSSLVSHPILTLPMFNSEMAVAPITLLLRPRWPFFLPPSLIFPVPTPLSLISRSSLLSSYKLLIA